MITAEFPAFPTETATDYCHGMELRTYMATQFMAGILASNECGIAHLPANAAEWAVSCADALIAELNKK